MKKLAILSDIHGNVTALKEVIKDLQKNNCDEIVCLGDISGRGPSIKECLELIKDLNPIGWVRGNHDEMPAALADLHENFEQHLQKPKAIMKTIYGQYEEQELTEDDFKFLAKLPIWKNIKIENVEIDIMHAKRARTASNKVQATKAQKNFEKFLKHSKSKVALYGHIHIQLMRWTEDGRLILNPGTIGYRSKTQMFKTAHAQYTIMTIVDDEITNIDMRNLKYDIEKELALAKEKELPYLKLYEKTLRYNKFSLSPYEIDLINKDKNYKEEAMKYYQNLKNENHKNEEDSI